MFNRDFLKKIKPGLLIETVRLAVVDPFFDTMVEIFFEKRLDGPQDVSNKLKYFHG